MNRDIKSLDTVTLQDLSDFREKTVVIIGAGGLGGYVIEMLLRFGIGHLRVVDGDVFDETNLNRQLYAREDNLGLPKAEEAALRAGLVRSETEVEVVKERLTADNAETLLKGGDVVMDCVDNVTARKVMSEVCDRLGIPLVHGAVGAWSGQVMTLLPGDGHLLRELYGQRDNDLPSVGAGAFIPANVASVQVAECVKILTGKGSLLRKKLKLIDLMENETFVVELEGEG